MRMYSRTAKSGSRFKSLLTPKADIEVRRVNSLDLTHYEIHLELTDGEKLFGCGFSLKEAHKDISPLR